MKTTPERKATRHTSANKTAEPAVQKGDRFYRDKLAALLGGQVNVTHPAGNIDVLTPAEVIEVKAVEHWKTALEKLRIYGHHYPLHRRRIHLYGETSPKKLLHIQQQCFREGVVVTWEE